MAKMKEVCQQTGLTEKTVRLYVKKGLLSPHTEERTHGMSYDFSSADIQRLKDIAVLRRTDFSISEISQLLMQPETLPGMIDEKKTLLEAEIYEKQAIQEALSRLSLTEQGSVTAFARSLGPVTHYIDRQEIPPKKHPRMFYLLLTLFLFGILLMLLAMQGAHLALAAVIFVILVGAVLSLIAAIRYLHLSVRLKSIAVWDTGQITAVIQESGIDAAYARAGMTAPGFSEPGRGGIWLIPMLLWGELRPDNWYPLIHCTAADTGERPVVVTTAYGAFRRTWREGQEVALAPAPGKPGQYLSADSGWLREKAVLYLLIAVILAITDWACIALFIQWYL